MFGTIALILVCVLSLYVAATYFHYSDKGDINNSLSGLDNAIKAENKDDVIKQLYHIIIKEQSSVRWPLFVALAVIFSVLITYATTNEKEDTLLMRKFIITLPFIFLPLYLSFNFFKAHGGNRDVVTATALYTRKF